MYGAGTYHARPGPHQTANRSYIEEGVQLLELAHRAPALFESQQPGEKCKLLNFVLSNCTWKASNSSRNIGNPSTRWQLRSRRNKSGWEREARKTGNLRIGSPIVDAFRTLVTFPPPAIRAAFLQIQSRENS